MTPEFSYGFLTGIASVVVVNIVYHLIRNWKKL